MVAALTNIINYKNKYYRSVPVAQPGDEGCGYCDLSVLLKLEPSVYSHLLTWSIVDLQFCVNFWHTAHWFSYAHIYFFMFFSIVIYYKILNMVLWVMWQDLVVHLMWIQGFVSVNPTLLIYPSCTAIPLWWPSICFLSLWVCLVNRFICIIFWILHMSSI